MSVTQTMSSMARGAAVRYGLLTDGWKAIYSRSLDDPRFGSAIVLRIAIEDAYGIAHRYLVTEGEEIEEAFTEIAQQALVSTKNELRVNESGVLPDALTDHVSAFVAHLLNEITIQIERDIAQLRKSLQNTILSVVIAASAQRLPVKTALIQHRIATTTDLNFSFTDRRTVKWPSGRYILTIWRHALLNLYNDVVLFELAAAGIDKAHVRHIDPDSENHGQEISLVANTNLPTYDDIRNQVFHPNADAIIARHV